MAMTDRGIGVAPASHRYTVRTETPASTARSWFGISSASANARRRRGLRSTASSVDILSDYAPKTKNASPKAGVPGSSA